MVPLRSNPALYTMMSDHLLLGLSGAYVDDLLRASPPSFRAISEKTRERFQLGEDEELPVTLSGFTPSRDSDGPLEQNQRFYMKNLEALSPSSGFKEFRSMWMKLAWLANTRPDCQFEISQLAQVTGDRFDEDKRSVIRRLNKATKYAIDNCVSLKIPALDKASVSVAGFADASFANNQDISTQLGHLCLLLDKNNRVSSGELQVVHVRMPRLRRKLLTMHCR